MAPIICKIVSRSPKKKKANTIVETGPKLATIEKLEAPNFEIAADTK